MSMFINDDLELRKAFDAFSDSLFFLIDKEDILLAKNIITNTLKRELIEPLKILNDNY